MNRFNHKASSILCYSVVWIRRRIDDDEEEDDNKEKDEEEAEEAGE